jgi:hypothetical protein
MFIKAAWGGITTLRNASTSREDAEPDDDQDLKRKLARDLRRQVVVCRRGAADLGRHVGPILGLRDRAVAERIDQGRGLVLRRAALGDRVEERGRSRLV